MRPMSVFFLFLQQGSKLQKVSCNWTFTNLIWYTFNYVFILIKPGIISPHTGHFAHLKPYFWSHPKIYTVNHYVNVIGTDTLAFQEMSHCFCVYLSISWSLIVANLCLSRNLMILLTYLFHLKTNVPVFCVCLSAFRSHMVANFCLKLFLHYNINISLSSAKWCSGGFISGCCLFFHSYND